MRSSLKLDHLVVDLHKVQEAVVANYGLHGFDDATHNFRSPDEICRNIDIVTHSLITQPGKAAYMNPQIWNREGLVRRATTASSVLCNPKKLLVIGHSFALTLVTYRGIRKWLKEDERVRFILPFRLCRVQFLRFLISVSVEKFRRVPLLRLLPSLDFSEVQ